MAMIDQLLKYAHDVGASDLHLKAGLAPRIRSQGHVQAIQGAPDLDQARLESILREIVRVEQWQQFRSTGDLDFAYGLEGVARFRANYFRQETGDGAVFRQISETTIPLADLGMPDSVVALAEAKEGLVLVTGPTGSGKSTTLASMIDLLNRTSSRHVVTIEDPVEFVHSSKRSCFSHREIGADAADFASALRAALRQDADVILVGELRDTETISLALTAAEMGCLVLATLHTNGASKTIARIVDAFPADQQAQARSSLADSLTGIVSQILLRTPDGRGRVAAVEVLVRTQGLDNMIRESNTSMIESLMHSGGKRVGMQTMDDSIIQLVKAGRADPEEAYRKVRDRDRFEQSLKGSGARLPSPA